MKKTLFALLLTLPVLSNALPAEEGYDLPVEHRLERLTEQLQLTPEQRSKLEVIFKEQHEKFRTIHEESHSRIKEVLTGEQLGKWEKMKQRHQEKRQKIMLEHAKP